MPLQLPVLDDRNFEQLLEEARRRIPVYTPEWTNFGVESDPGITIVQLFAFLTESLLYRANRIPDRNRLKFLQLLGIPLQPAAPADGLIAIRNERGPVAAATTRTGRSGLGWQHRLPHPRPGQCAAGRGAGVLQTQASGDRSAPMPSFQAKYEAIRPPGWPRSRGDTATPSTNRRSQPDNCATGFL